MFTKMFDIITFGSAAQDIHLKSKLFTILKDEKDFVTGSGICLPLGSKIDVDEIFFTTGGGGTNTAATFAKQGFKVSFCGAIGADAAGLEIVRELKHLRIDTRFLVKKKEKHTNQSVIISSNGQDSTILIYRGASDELREKDINWKKIKHTKWFYLAPMTGSLCDNFGKIVDYGYQRKIKIAVNPSKEQLSLPIEQLKPIFQKVDVLILNLEEAAFLTELPIEQETDILNAVKALCPGVVVVTKGSQGVIVSNGKNTYSALPRPNFKIADTTGAGDSFASGFLSDFIRNNGDIEKAIQLGMANSESNLTQVGAKIGLLEKNSQFERASVQKI
jgi:ribokinase